MGKFLRLAQRHADGVLIVDGQQRDTVQCAHCGGHWEVDPGSGTKRGWCMRCNRATCGAGACRKCQTQEQLIEAIERRARLEENLRQIRS